MTEIQTIGFEKLSEQEMRDFEKISEEYTNKITRKLENISNFRIKLKEHQKKGPSKRYSISALIETNSNSIEAKAEDWDLKKALHILFKKLIAEIEHKFHSSNQNRR